VFRLVLEDCLAELEQQRALQDAAGHTQKEEWEERLRGAQLGEESARKELQILRLVRGVLLYPCIVCITNIFHISLCVCVCVCVC
jgi:hypothetical protein